MLSKQKTRRCFIIGGMKDMSRMEKLRDQIVKPILEPYNFTVITPDEGEIGNIMRQVLLNLEQADLLIADITGHNPNVMYELGVYHSFGKPYLVIKDRAAKEHVIDTPFDIAEYRFHSIDFDDIAGSKNKMEGLLKNIINKIDVLDWFGNPVTDFYQSPVAEIPTAVGLSKNYKKNFMDMVLPHVFQKDEKGINYKIEVWVETNENDSSGKPLVKELSYSERKNLTMEILIPGRMNIASHTFIVGLKDEEKINFKSAEVGRRTRPFKMHYRIDKNKNYVLIDIPTILSTLNESIEQRRQNHLDQIGTDEWEILEQQELERFAGKCELYRRKDLEAKYPECKNKLKIVWDWYPETDLDNNLQT